MWTYSTANKTAPQVADEYARVIGREVDQLTFHGDWNNMRFDGTFKLVDGFATYAISYTQPSWTVQRLAD